ncbi:GGDEF domain-containing protein [Rhodoferax saidenbachensis]|uniref:diguanylate cyclase n=1 Tax=Rhodoferax saidenbachensis TaxID=1484693 RepID=A0A1P8K516_9BURK|nr:GGDEF domain-containing protein [Rhodoferax saidenbachensis]APW41103.1 GGDEF domain-containing protein [Rhodoferax saidenbachensis]
MSDKKPFEIARETLKQLTARKLVPTPSNYQTLYNEIAGIPHMPPFPADTLRDIAKALPTKTPGQQKQRGLLEYAIDRLNWEGVKTALVAYGGFVPVTPPGNGTPGVPISLVDDEVGGATAPALTAEFMAQIGRMIEYSQPALGNDDVRFTEQTEALLTALRQPGADLANVKQMLVNYSHRLSFAAEDQAEIKDALLKLLHLVFENIGDLSLDEQWLKGQMDALMSASTPPLTLRRLDDVERRLKDVIFKQKDAKERAVQAQNEMREMLAAFIDRLSQMASSSGVFYEKLESSARLIEQAKTLAEIAPVLKDVVGATRGMAQDSKQSRDELHAMRVRAMATDAEVAKLHQELDRVSTQARHDTLTGTLNRKGLDEAMERELSTVKRKETPLCMALLDIDNFKKLNDTMGHATGDAALAHLATVARESMRPQDTLARYGGEEFVILMPDTPLDKGIEAMTRLQRELTKRFFLAGTEKILITFSAGVAQLAPQESGGDAIRRADQAMYLAKRAGKNRVLGA